MSQLRNSDGEMCCLGFDAVACGIPIEEITGIGTPEGLLDRAGEWMPPPSYLKGRVEFVEQDIEHPWRHTPHVDEAIQVNDDGLITDTERELQLIPLLLKLGYDRVEFIP